MFNRIINKIKNQYKQAVYIDNNGNKNTNMSLDADNKAFIIAEQATHLLYNLADKYLINKHFAINLSQYKHTVYFNNTPAGICGDSFTNSNGNAADIEFHVKQFDSNIKKQIITQFKKDYKYQLNIISANIFTDINKQLEQFITNNFYLGILMIFINNELIDFKGYFLPRKQKNQLHEIGKKLINKFTHEYS